MKVPDVFNSAQSLSSGSTENDYLTQFAGASALRGSVQAELTGLGSSLTPDQIVKRARALSCAGCHRFSGNLNIVGNSDLGGGLTWPASLGFTHVSEQITTVDSGIVRFAISPALQNSFLPVRKQVMDSFLDDKPFNTSAAGDQALGDALYAAPLVSNTLSRVFVATRNLSGSQNRIFGLVASTGACQWVFNGDCSGTVGTSNVGQISAMPILDAANYRLFFTSTKLSTGSTVWALDAHDTPSGSRILWQRDLGDSDSAMTFSSAARTSVLVSTAAGRIYHLSASTGATCWGSTSDGCDTTTGSEQFFCTASGTSARATSCTSGSAVVKSIVTLQGAYVGYFAFSTSDGYVRLVNSAGVQQWRTSVTGASAPLVLTSAGKIYLGGSDGLVHELALSTGTQTKTQSAGGTGVTVGEPSYDGTDNVLYVNTTQGSQYAFTVPF